MSPTKQQRAAQAQPSGGQMTRTAPVAEEALMAIDKAISDCRGVMTLAAAGSMLHAIKIARGMTLLQDLITSEIMAEILPLMNSPLGFDTDRNPKKDPTATPYSESVVKDCFIVATLKGARPAGNEWNIIASSAYLTKAAYKRMIKEFPGLTEFRPEYGVPRISGDGAIVPCKATWKLDGKPQSLQADIPVRLNRGMGADAALGKAERKFHYRVFCLISGTEHDPSEMDADDSQVLDGQATTVRDTVQQTLDADRAHAQAEGSQVAPPAEATEDQINFAELLQQEINAAESLEQMKHVAEAIGQAINEQRITAEHAQKLRTHWKAKNESLKAAEKSQKPLPNATRQPGDEA